MFKQIIFISGLLLLTHFSNAQSSLKSQLPSTFSIAISLGKWLIKDTRKFYYVQIESTGKTADLARSDGFKLAVSQAVGTVVVAETEVKNDMLIRKDIIQYSSGYVDDFKIIKETQIGDMTRIVMDVWVSESKIADRLLNTSKAPGSIEGSKVAAQYKTLLDEKQSGDQLLITVLKDFPERAFDIKIGKTQTQLKARNLEIRVPITISWNSKYIDALLEVLVHTRQSNLPLLRQSRDASPLPSIIMIDRKKDWFATYAGYTDKTKELLLEKYLIDISPRVQIIFKDDSGEEINSSCIQFDHMSGGFFSEGTFGYYPPDIGDRPGGQFFASWASEANFGIYGDYVLNKNIVLILENFSKEIESLNSVEVKVIELKKCIKN